MARRSAHPNFSARPTPGSSDSPRSSPDCSRLRVRICRLTRISRSGILSGMFSPAARCASPETELRIDLICMPPTWPSGFGICSCAASRPVHITSGQPKPSQSATWRIWLCEPCHRGRRWKSQAPPEPARPPYATCRRWSVPNENWICGCWCRLTSKSAECTSGLILHKVVAEHVANDQVSVFNAAHLRFCNANLQLCHGAQFPAVAARQRDRIAAD